MAEGLTIADLLDAYLGYLERQRGRRPNTLKAYRRDLASAAAAMPKPVDVIRYQEIAAWLESCAAASTHTRRRASISGFFGWLVRMEYIVRDPTTNLESRRPDRALPRPVDHGDRSTMDRAIAIAPHPYRLLFTMLRETGMRISEALALNVGDVNLTPGHEGLAVRATTAKSRVERHVALGPNSTPRTLRLLRQHLKQIADSRPTSPLFVSNRATRIGYTTAVYQWEKLCTTAKLLDSKGKPRYSIHQIRHTAGTELLEAGQQLEVVRRRLGHKDIRSTLGYAELSDTAVRDALERGGR